MQHLVLTLCGSARFERLYCIWNEALTLAGHTVFSLAVMPSTKDAGKDWYDQETKTLLDAAHLRKIDASDAIVVLNRDGYIGESTLREIVHARRVYFLESWGRGNGLNGVRSPISTRRRVVGQPRNHHAFDLLGPPGELRSQLVNLVREVQPEPPVPNIVTPELAAMRGEGAPDGWGYYPRSFSQWPYWRYVVNYGTEDAFPVWVWWDGRRVTVKFMASQRGETKAFEHFTGPDGAFAYVEGLTQVCPAPWLGTY